MKNRVRFYGTFGPACQSEEVLVKLLESGMTGIRLNLSHTSLADCEGWISNYKSAQKKTGVKGDLLIDLQGPELRLGVLAHTVELKEDDTVILTASEETRASHQAVLPIPKIVMEYLQPGQKILVNDGVVRLLAEIVIPNMAVCRVLRGGTVSSRKSIALEGMEIPAPTLNDMDMLNLSNAKAYGVTEVMLPFVRGKEDVLNLRNTLDALELQKVKIHAKIENLTGVEMLDEIMEYADVLVVARGDLGNAQPLWKLPALQKKIAAKCKMAGKPFVVATQMLKTMVHSAVPTRAEVSDIYNAVLDGASVLLLTEETAVGEYPVEAMEYLVHVGREAELVLCEACR